MTREDIYQLIKIAGGILFIAWFIPQILKIRELLTMIWLKI